MQLNWPSEHIWEQITPLWPDFSVEILSTVDSTNTQLLQRIHNGQTAPTLLVAETQTAGKGRAGKKWAAHIGDSLTFSLALPMPAHIDAKLSLAVGCALAQALDPSGHALKIKWPNDIWFNLNNNPTHQTTQNPPDTQKPAWRKLVGILIETASYARQRYAVIGIGININLPPQNILAPTYTANSIPAGSLAQLDKRWDAPQALACVAPQILQAVYNFMHQGEDSWQKNFTSIYAQRDLLAGTPLITSDGTHGTGIGIDPQGHLLIQTADGIQVIHSGEVSVRPC